MLSKSVQVAIVLTISLTIVTASGHGDKSDFGGDFDEIHKASGKFEHLGTYVGKHHNPPKIIKIIKTVAVKVPVPVHIPKFIKYPVPFPVHVPKIIKVKEHFPFPEKDSHNSHENLEAHLGSGGDGGHFEGHSFGGSAEGFSGHDGGQAGGHGGDGGGHGGEASGSFQHEEFSHSGYGNNLGGDLQQSYGSGESFGHGSQGGHFQESQAAPVNYHVLSQGASPGHDASAYYSTGGIHEVPAPLLNSGYGQGGYDQGGHDQGGYGQSGYGQSGHGYH